jgi:hypothetical protein
MARSTNDVEFNKMAQNWLREQEEVLALFQYSRMAGAKDWFILKSYEELCARVEVSPPNTRVTVFRRPQLQLRGTVDDTLVEQAMAVIPDGAEYLWVSIGAHTGWWSEHGAGESHHELREHLLEQRGAFIAVGLYPPWLGEDEDVITGYRPDPLGNVNPGSY